jgi:phosphate transport system permease protein
MTATTSTTMVNSLTTGQLPRWAPWALLVGSFVVVGAIFALAGAGGDPADFNVGGTLFLGALLYIVLITVFSSVAESRRKAVDRLVTALVTSAFVVVLIPLVSLLYTVIINGVGRMDAEFFSSSMRNVVGDGGGAVHAIWGTILITLGATVVSVPIGLMTSIYLVEYGRGSLARAITFFVDVMTGIPSIVAGLFAYLLFSIIFGPGVRLGIAGAVALSVLMIPVVVRSSEEMLRLVPNELREASYALGVPKWLTILKVVLPTALAGITTGVMLAISRVIGETAPLLIAAGFTQNMNYDLTDGRMMSLPVYVYNAYVSTGADVQASIDRAWAGALTLILIVMLLNLVARIIAKAFSPKLGR